MAKELTEGGAAKKKAIEENYVQVKDRLKLFRADHPDWAIDSEVKELDKGQCLMKVSIYGDDGKLMSGAHSHEKLTDNILINSTSMVENCETSALGRALAFLGYKVDKSIASADEMRKTKAHVQVIEVYTGTSKQKATLGRALRACSITDHALGSSIHHALIKAGINDDVLSLTKYIKGYEA